MDCSNHLKYGWGSFRPRYLQWLNSSRWFLFFLTSASLTSVLSTPTFFIPGCRTLEFAGVNAAYRISSTVDLSIQSSCNRNCSCSSLNYNPVCGVDGITYYGPCQAGCSERIGSVGYTNCSCIDVPYSSGPQVTEGFCDRKCKNFYLFMMSLCIALLCFGMAVTPVKTVLIRCVSENQRAYAMGFQVVILKVFAFLPAPVIFGSYFDTKCLGAIFFYFSWRCYKPPPTENCPNEEITEQELLCLQSRQEIDHDKK
ncbi:hypothetical protein QZH41_019262 [Actinostola sp. cb2023]|nr:hypothetical protein QZH41_019262 [Actinostola sp. cb2023]